jgi:hypothetical protein
MIVKESIEFQRGGKSPLKSLRIGQIEVLRKELEKKNFGFDACIDNLERISRKYTRKHIDKVYFTRELSDALDQTFGPDFKDAKAPKQQKEAHSDKSRRFFKDLLKNVKLNDSQISEEELLEYIIEFSETITPDPLWFEAVLGSFSYTAEMY